MPSSPREQKLRTAPTTHSAMGAAFGGLHLQLCTHSPFRHPLVTFPPRPEVAVGLWHACGHKQNQISQKGFDTTTCAALQAHSNRGFKLLVCNVGTHKHTHTQWEPDPRAPPSPDPIPAPTPSQPHCAQAGGPVPSRAPWGSVPAARGPVPPLPLRSAPAAPGSSGLCCWGFVVSPALPAARSTAGDDAGALMGGSTDRPQHCSPGCAVRRRHTAAEQRAARRTPGHT